MAIMLTDLLLPCIFFGEGEDDHGRQHLSFTRHVYFAVTAAEIAL